LPNCPSARERKPKLTVGGYKKNFLTKKIFGQDAHTDRGQGRIRWGQRRQTGAGTSGSEVPEGNFLNRVKNGKEQRPIGSGAEIDSIASNQKTEAQRF